MQWLDLTAISYQRRNAGGVNMGWGEWGDWSDMAPIITQVAPVEASILSVPSLMCLFSAAVEGATNILWYINDKLISEKPSDGNNTPTTIFDNDPLDPEKDLLQLDPEGVIVPTRKLKLKTVNSQEENIREWNKYYYIYEPDPIDLVVDSVSPPLDACNLQVEGLSFTINFKIPADVMWVVDRNYNILDPLQFESNVMSSSYTYDNNESIFDDGVLVCGHHTITAIITSIPPQYGCFNGVHWKTWVIPSNPLLSFSAKNSVIGNNSRNAFIMSTFGLYSLTWDGIQYVWEFRMLSYGSSKIDGNESEDLIIQRITLEEIWNIDLMNIVFEADEPTDHGASYPDTPTEEAILAIGSIFETLASHCFVQFGILLSGAEVLSNIGEVTSFYSVTPEKTEVQWEHDAYHSNLYHWIRFCVKTTPGNGYYQENKFYVESKITSFNYFGNDPMIKFGITLPNIMAPNQMEMPLEYGFKIENINGNLTWVLDDPTIIMKLMTVEAMEGELVEE